MRSVYASGPQKWSTGAKGRTSSIIINLLDSAILGVVDKVKKSLNCENLDGKSLNWDAFREEINKSPTQFIGSTMRWAWGRGALDKARTDEEFFKECPFGAITIIMIRVAVAQHGMSEHYSGLIWPHLTSHCVTCRKKWS